ncbi:MAG: O-acetylhomoserine aminocarboxypropyltransferase/cysteine synthase [Candidatus Margulisbacteria bacterium]|nr:O-acetylhomoserine aminocarboxypropyltransferase/cysteine synthase [Candidatus Margulisiibacteriota bacterium]
MNFETKAIHAGFESDPTTGATTFPIYQTASYEYESAEEHSDVFFGRKFGHQYSRITNPTVAAYENRITALTDGKGTLCTASGMAAITTALLSLTSAGDEIIAAKSLFGGTYYLFKHVFENFDITVNYVDTTDLASYEAAITDKTRAIFLETIGNPKMDVPDIAKIAALASQRHIPLVVDGTTTTPYLFDAKAHGVSILVLSTTKYLCGSGTTIGGSITDLGTFDWKQTKSPRIKEVGEKFGDMAFLARARRQVQSNTGSTMSPMNAFIASLGLDTLTLRMDKHCANALALATYFQAHPNVKAVHYPGLSTNPDHDIAKRQFKNRYGGLLTIQVGSKEAAYRVINETKLARILVNIGDTKTLVVHPKSTIYRDFTEQQADEAGVFDDLIRISVGLEHIDDLKADFDQALKKAII